VTINRACGSGRRAPEYAAHAVLAGQAKMIVAGGVACRRVPLGAARKLGMPYGPRVLPRYDGFSFNQGISAEMIAGKWALTREELDGVRCDTSVERLAKLRPPSSRTGKSTQGTRPGFRTVRRRLLARLRELGASPDRLNVLGGAIHPP
jgi:hypothetical protein